MSGLGGVWSGGGLSGPRGCLVLGGVCFGGVWPVGGLVPGGCAPRGCAPGGVWSQGVSALGVSGPGEVSGLGGVCLGVSAWGCVWSGGCLVQGGIWLGGCLVGGQVPGVSALGGVGIPVCIEADTLPVNRMTDACKNITLAQLHCGR